MARHRTKILFAPDADRPGFIFECRDCLLRDYSSPTREKREDAVDDARAHRFAYRAIDAALLEAIFKGVNK